VPGARALPWTLHLGNSLQTAIALVSIRSLTRSRQHRVAFAFYLAFVFALALSLLREDLASTARIPVPMDLIVPTILMMFFAIGGLRNVCSLPISLTANWVLRTTQLRPSEDYVAATRRTLLLLAAAPAWLLSLALAYRFTPFRSVAEHLVVLALIGLILVELGLIGFYKIPFTCSYLPGKANVQLLFWGFVIVLVAVLLPFAEFEKSALGNSSKFSFLLSVLAATEWALWMINRQRARAAIIYFEEIPDEPITTLKLSA
jgi:hypothetical protein